jgi:isochorismate hydrolase
VTGQSGILSTSQVQAFLMADSTSDHTVLDHTYAALFIALTCGAIVPGTGFTVYATSQYHLEGTFALRWKWI